MKEETKEKLNEQLEEKICEILDEKIQPSNIEMLDVLIDIHKDIENEKYWERKVDIMNYGRGYREGSYGRRGYREGSYGRRERDSRGRYKGHEYMDEMYSEYSNYEEGRGEYNRGNYGAKDETLKSLEYMLESMVDFVEMLKQEAGSQEEIQLIREYTQRIAQM
jgi:hypothetical protein